ncbi:hypothetical protein [Aquipuribacter nitratireducens]|uniref:hypothetical protein n=1 Tax=Aquipuribacter nitratireducens TaxID=650104 RepID=UPI0030EE9B09
MEPLGDLGRGAEFVLHKVTSDESHQVKRQVGNANEWTVAGLKKLKVFETAKRNAGAGRNYHFVSTVPFRPLQELADRARNSNDYSSFVLGGLPNDLNDLLTELGELYGGVESAYGVLRRFFVRLVDEAELRHNNTVIAELLLEGGTGLQARAALGEIIDDNIDVQLTADRLLEKLRPYGIQRRLLASRQGLAERVRVATATWLRRVERQMMQPVIPRAEAGALRDLLTSSDEAVHFLVGAAGGGKTAVLHQAVEQLVADDVPTLVLRLDRFDRLDSTNDLGQQLELDVSPVVALAAASDGRPSMLVLDQLDAVSLASGRLPENFDVIADLVSEAMAIPDMRVVLGCRHFDVDNDHRIRTLRDRVKAGVQSVALLSVDQVTEVVGGLGLSAAALTDQQLDILRLPLHLSLLATIADEPAALDFANSQRLFDEYWEYKLRAVRQKRESVRFNQVASRIARAISERQALAVPISVLDVDDLLDDAMVLVSEHLLVRDGRQVAFFHESIFDYAFARQWVSSGETLVQFLAAGEQELFVRGQVRQIMAHLRALDPDRYVDEVRGLLESDAVRFHIKDAAVGVLSVLPDPTTAEAELVVLVADGDAALATRLWTRLRTRAWFGRLDDEGYIGRWLDGDDEQQRRVLNLMPGAIADVPDRVAAHLAEHRQTPAYGGWVRWAMRFAQLEQHRGLFDTYLDAVRSGLYDGFEQEMWLAVHRLGDRRPEWAVEVLVAYLVDRPGALAPDARGEVAALKNREHSAAELARAAAAKAPQAFVDGLLPYLLRVMAETSYDSPPLSARRDKQFSFRYPESRANSDLDDLLLDGMAAALASVVATEGEALRPTLDVLAADQHDSAQWLLYNALAAGGHIFADWGAELLLADDRRLMCGDAREPLSMTRKLLQAITPCVSNLNFQRLEDKLRTIRFPWENLPFGYPAFYLLSALDEGRLSEQGQGRLAELRRKYGMDQPPQDSLGITGGVVESPIMAESARQMDDANWLKAMGKYIGEERDYRVMTGGAEELSRVLEEEVRQEPERFARLALQLTPQLNPAYAAAVLRGLGAAPEPADIDVALPAIRHLAGFQSANVDRWLQSALRPYLADVPLDVVELVCARALSTRDPEDDGIRIWSQDAETDERVADIEGSGINTARGSLAITLGNLLCYDVDGQRTAVVVPALERFAQDPSIPVRTCVAHLLAMAMRHAREEAITAFWALIGSDDSLLASRFVVRCIAYIGAEDPEAVRPVIDRMLASDVAAARETGGEVAAYAAMKWEMREPLETALGSEMAEVRKGVAGAMVQQVGHASDVEIASATLVALFGDDNDTVRREVAGVAGELRGLALSPFYGLLVELINSPTFREALPQLLITLERAPDKVDPLILLTAQRFIQALGAEAADISTSAAGDAPEVGQLVIRGLAQTRKSDKRAALLDVIDDLLRVGAYGIDDLVAESER